jgi:hypothetical protein
VIEPFGLNREVETWRVLASDSRASSRSSCTRISTVETWLRK